jgi:small conductance mechanosensitive channel
MINIFQNSEVSNITNSIIHSLWFSFVIRAIFLFIFIKISKVILLKIQDKITSQTTSIESKKQIMTIFELGRHIIYFVLVAMFLVAFLGKVGIDIKPFLATAGVAGLAIGFASKKFIEDLLEGLSIISSGQIRIGDYVSISGYEGTVEKIDLKMITLRAINGNVHYIRNGNIEIITNYTREYSVALMDLSVSYNENPDKVLDVLKDIFYSELKTNPEFAPKIIGDIELLGLTDFGESAISIRTRIKTLPKEQWAVQREFNKLILERFKKENIEIPYNYLNVIIPPKAN